MLSGTRFRLTVTDVDETAVPCPMVEGMRILHHIPGRPYGSPTIRSPSSGYRPATTTSAAKSSTSTGRRSSCLTSTPWRVPVRWLYPGDGVSGPLQVSVRPSASTVDQFPTHGSPGLRGQSPTHGSGGTVHMTQKAHAAAKTPINANVRPMALPVDTTTTTPIRVRCSAEGTTISPGPVPRRGGLLTWRALSESTPRSSVPSAGRRRGPDGVRTPGRRTQARAGRRPSGPHVPTRSMPSSAQIVRTSAAVSATVRPGCRRSAPRVTRWRTERESPSSRVIFRVSPSRSSWSYRSARPNQTFSANFCSDPPQPPGWPPCRQDRRADPRRRTAAAHYRPRPGIADSSGTADL